MSTPPGALTSRLDHLALAVPNLEAARTAYTTLGYVAGDIGEFPSENTREVYIETRPVRVLLQEPRSESGPIAKALRDRGPGLHHMGLVVPDLAAFLESIAGSGWYFTSSSFKLIRMIGTAWLVRPDAGLLAHVSQAREDEPGPPPSVERVSIASKDREATKRLLGTLNAGNVPLVAGTWNGLTVRVPELAAAGAKLRAAGCALMTPDPVPTAEGRSWTVDASSTGGLALELVAS